jgi:putative acetyltransferase
MLIRSEEPKDYLQVWAVNMAAFRRQEEADLVDELREKAKLFISLVAEDKEVVVGHIMFSPVRLSGNLYLKMMGLGPMAVIPDHQAEGIGSALVKEGLKKCTQLGFGAVVVLGHSGYYPRFGFTPSIRYSIRSEYAVPEEVFMVKELQPGYLHHVSGIIQYHAAFKNV